MKKYLLLLILYTFYCSDVFAQGADCADAEAFCSGSPAIFPAGVDNGDFQPAGNLYMCGTGTGQELFTQPNAAWYYLELSTSGDIVLDLTNSNDVDIDFAAWGPFADIASAQASCGSLTNIVDCSFDPQSVEQVNIPGALVGEVYLVMVTNYSNLSTDISIADAVTNTATTDCSIVTACNADVGTINGSDVVLCAGDAASISSGGDAVLPDPVDGEESELMYAIYNCAPTNPTATNYDPASDPCYSNILWTGQDFDAANAASYAVNNGGVPQAFIDIGVTGDNNTIWLLPITADDGDNNGNPNDVIGYDNDGDGCFDVGTPISVTYTPTPSINIVDNCDPNTNSGSIDVVVTGGGTYTISETGAGSTVSSTVDGDGSSFTITGLNDGNTYSFDLTINGCPNSFSGTFNCAADVCLIDAAITPTPPPSDYPNNQYPPNTTVQFCFDINQYNHSNFNFLHGIVPEFGVGWDASSITEVSTPAVAGNDEVGSFWQWENPGTVFSNNGTTTTGDDFPIDWFGWWFYSSNSVPCYSGTTQAICDATGFGIWDPACGCVGVNLWVGPGGLADINDPSMNQTGCEAISGTWSAANNVCILDVTDSVIPTDPNNSWGDGCTAFCYPGTDQATCLATGFGEWIPGCGCAGNAAGDLWVGISGGPINADIEDATMTQAICESYNGTWATQGSAQICIFPEAICYVEPNTGFDQTWQACFALTTVDDPTCTNVDLSVSLTTYSDGVTGGYVDIGCLGDVAITSDYADICCILDPTETTPPNFCEGTSINLTANDNGIGILTWFTDATGGTPIGTGSPFDPGTLAAGSYTYYVEEDNNGCLSDRVPVSFVVDPLPSLTVVQGNALICDDNTTPVTLEINATNASSISWTANPGGAAGSGNSISVNPSVTTIYTATATNGCGTEDAVIVVSVEGCCNEPVNFINNE